MKQDAKQQVIELIEQPLKSAACELADVVVSRYKNRATVRVFVYAKGGVTLKRCADLSGLVGDIIDGTDLFEGGYTLEVSSPGLDRPLTSVRDFKYRVGETVRIEFADSRKKKITAEVIAVDGDEVTFKDESGTFSVTMADIGKAKIIY